MRIICVVDNAVAAGSSFRGEHGLAFVIEAESGSVLYDTGSTGAVLSHNLEAAGLTYEGISALVLSHSHDDHTGGLPPVLLHRPGLAVFAHPDLLRERFSLRDGRIQSRGLPLSPQELRRKSDLRLSAEPEEVLPGIWTTGEIVERAEPEGRSPHHVVREGDGWAPDPYSDDMALVLECSQGLVLVCGCCHAGLLNTMKHVRRVFGHDPVAVVGGLHLTTADEDQLKRLVGKLQRLESLALHPNHCTGEAAYVALVNVLGHRVAPCPAGTVLEF